MRRSSTSRPRGAGTGSAPARVRHIFTVDVEEHFHVNGFESWVPREEWERYPSRVTIGTERVLDLLARHDARATFFTLGWVARRQPELIRRIAAAGHEIASHGDLHRRIPTLTPDEFRADVRRAKRCIEDCTGVAVQGFRAPSFSVTKGFEWALDVLVEEGHTYDSSLFPIRRPDYGYAGALTIPHIIRTPSGPITELPLAVATFGPVRMPAAGGGYLRQFPLSLMQRALRQHEARRVPAMCYVHPWELDPEQPRIDVPWVARVRHYRNLERVGSRLEQLFGEFRFGSVREWMGEAPRNQPSVTLGRQIRAIPA